MDHYDKRGNKIGSSKRQEGFFEPYTAHYDKRGNKVGESRSEEGLFGPHTAHYDKHGNKVGTSKPRGGGGGGGGIRVGGGGVGPFGILIAAGGICYAVAWIAGQVWKPLVLGDEGDVLRADESVVKVGGFGLTFLLLGALVAFLGVRSYRAKASFGSASVVVIAVLVALIGGGVAFGAAPAMFEDWKVSQTRKVPEDGLCATSEIIDQDNGYEIAATGEGTMTDCHILAVYDGKEQVFTADASPLHALDSRIYLTTEQELSRRSNTAVLPRFETAYAVWCLGAADGIGGPGQSVGDCQVMSLLEVETGRRGLVNPNDHCDDEWAYWTWQPATNDGGLPGWEFRCTADNRGATFFVQASDFAVVRS